MSSIPRHIVVVGAGLGGVRTIEHLRRKGYDGAVTLLGDEPHQPYDRPPLSKQILTGAWEADRATLRDAAGLRDLGVDSRLGTRAVALRGNTVELADGAAVSGDAVVIATGARARTLPGQPEGALTLRSLDDALALRGALGGANSLIVIGAGFIGAEVASAARALGFDVTVLEAMRAPAERALGRHLGAYTSRLMTDAGIDLRCSVRIARIPDRHTVETADGTTLRADIVLVAVGAAPNVGWLTGSGVDTGDGVACDPHGRVRDGVWAVGDVAAWFDPIAGTTRRSEHWTSTIDQAAIVACDLLGEEIPASAPAYVWSDQFGTKIQTAGHVAAADDVVVLHGRGLASESVKGTVVGGFTGGVLVGAASFGAPAQFMRYRQLIAAGADRETVLAQADDTRRLAG